MNRKERVGLANSYIVGYANDFITDEECNDMIDLALNEISIVNGEGIIWDNTFDEESDALIRALEASKIASIEEKDDWCHYSGMPSPEAYKK